MISVYVIGCGAVGRSVARALAVSGKFRLVGIHDANPGCAEAAGEELGVPADFGALGSAVGEAEIVIVATPVRSISDVAREAVRTGKCGERQIWLHTDGSAAASELGPLSGKVRGIGVLHPARVFPPGRTTPLESMDVFAVSGDEDAASAGLDVARGLGCGAVRVADGARQAYHAAAVLASNCAVALLDEARQLLVSSCGLGAEDAEGLVVGLASSAVGAAAELGIDSALSGPIRRGEVETVRGHLLALAARPSARDAYRVLGRSVLALARRTPGYPQIAAAEIERILKDGDSCS